MALAALLGFNSCCEDRGPKYEDPTEFILNTPEMENLYFVLEEGQTFDLVASQPNFGYSAVATYNAEVSLDPEFSDPTLIKTIKPVNSNLARMTFKQINLLNAITAISGAADETEFNAWLASVDEDGDGYIPLYFRAVCQISNIESAYITSNIVALNYVKPYFAVPEPGKLYIVGDVNGWKEPAEANANNFTGWILYESEDAIGSGIYSNGDKPIALPANPMFRFYTALTGWDADSYGSQGDDNPIDDPNWLGVTPFEKELVKGKGSFQFSSFQGGNVNMVVDMSDPTAMKFTMTLDASSEPSTPAPLPEVIYMVGNNGYFTNATQANYGTYGLTEIELTGVFEGVFTLPADLLDGDGNPYLKVKFVESLNGADVNSDLIARWSATLVDGNVEICQPGKAYSTTKGNHWFDFRGYQNADGEWTGVAGQKIRVLLNTNSNQVSFRYAD